jgi:putative FmdB family regulatory protein
MPIYEFRCAECKRKFEVLVLRTEEKSSLRCPRCDGTKIKRLLSRFASIKSEEARLESLTDPSNLAGLDENDPASMARWLKRMGGELGEDVSKEEVDQMADEIASGKALDEGPGGDSGLGDGDMD